MPNEVSIGVAAEPPRAEFTDRQPAGPEPADPKPAGPKPAGPKPAGVLRRLGAILYDTVLLFGVLAVVGLLALPWLGGKLPTPGEIGDVAYMLRGIQALIIVGFFGYFWTQRGQTLGMLAWRLRITNTEGRLMGWGQCLRRLATLTVLLLPFFVGDWLWFSRWPERWRHIALYVSCAPLLACYAWIWIDREQRAWHDRASGTRVWVLPRSG